MPKSKDSRVLFSDDPYMSMVQCVMDPDAVVGTANSISYLIIAADKIWKMTKIIKTQCSCCKDFKNHLVRKSCNEVEPRVQVKLGAWPSEFEGRWLWPKWTW